MNFKTNTAIRIIQMHVPKEWICVHTCVCGGVYMPMDRSDVRDVHVDLCASGRVLFMNRKTQLPKGVWGGCMYTHTSGYSVPSPPLPPPDVMLKQTQGNMKPLWHFQFIALISSGRLSSIICPL